MNKNQTIYQFIRSRKSVSKQDIVLGLQYSLPTITQKLKYLENLRVIDTTKKIMNTGGRNATAYTYVQRARSAIGIYLTGQYINGVAVDLSGDVIEMMKTKMPFDLDNDLYLKEIGKMVEELKSSAHIDDRDLLGVGIALQGLVSEDGEEVIYGRTLGFTGARREDIAKYIPYRNRLFHDSNAAGYAEGWISEDICNAFYISLSNSVGGAIIMDNEIYTGNNVKGGEIGHMTAVPKGGNLCYCGNRGCFETVCTSTILEQCADGSLDRFFAMLDENDETAKEIWDEYLDHLSIGIHNIRMLFDSDIIIGGYVGAYIDKYFEELCRRVDARNAFGDQAKNYLLPCSYKVESAAAGAAIRYIEEFFKQI